MPISRSCLLGNASPVRNLGGELRTGIRPGEARAVPSTATSTPAAVHLPLKCGARFTKKAANATRASADHTFIAELGELVGRGLLKRRTVVTAHQQLARSLRRRRPLRQLLRPSNDPPCSPAHSPIRGICRDTVSTQISAKGHSRLPVVGARATWFSRRSLVRFARPRSTLCRARSRT